MDYRDLTDLQIDALREVVNIGAGNAASALSQLIQKRIDMAVPQVDILPIEKVVSKIGGEEQKIVAVVLRIFGDAPGNVVFLLTMESSYRLIKMLTGQEAGDEFSEFQMSALQEVGNILTGAYINAIIKLTGMMMLSSIPAISIDMLLSLMTSVFMESEQYGEHIMSIETKFQEGNEDISSHFFYIPKPGSLKKLIQALGLM